LVFLPDGGDVQLDLTEFPSGDLVEARWMDAYTGETDVVEVEDRNFRLKLENPLTDTANPCVVYVRNRSESTVFLEAEEHASALIEAEAMAISVSEER
ncbi:MAG: hypothetical protein O3A46_15615, partial [Candidatus Poribacteria bacterium]|nr:hypothetical protein [Candidatus Poribacteria bacterium]